MWCRLLRDKETRVAGEATEGHSATSLRAPRPALLPGIPRHRYHIPAGGRGGLCLRHCQCSCSTPHQVYTVCRSTSVACKTSPVVPVWLFELLLLMDRTWVYCRISSFVCCPVSHTCSYVVSNQSLGVAQFIINFKWNMSCPQK